MITNDIGRLFAVMQANYGQRWTHGADAIPVWLEKLNGAKAEDVLKAANRAIDLYLDWPPSLGEFAALVRESTPRLPGPATENIERATRIFAYAQPYHQTRNPQGNPHQISLPESVATREPGETVEQYRKRISDAVTFAKYPKLGPDGRSVPGAYGR